ncbi:hypothetical protein CORC01_14397 [Colletotrichum orchidophilum]|uniref:Uncharacterized protein n=1 Tax=Colletotrichum orchidophilum TaxID=1209926 RepID=A0A1G4AMA1_9PEZI|nr:uncharacterized protein CORC01_14397 [Colletotrichum orchidophilum]OHE90310.1 hypothetical protein CORC01_14397 [Colletotrichum orchidophilum]
MEFIDLIEAHQSGVAAERLHIVIDLTQDDEISYVPGGASPNRSRAAPAGTTCVAPSVINEDAAVSALHTLENLDSEERESSMLNAPSA